MESRVITTYDEFSKLRVPWQELHSSAQGCLFQLHDWLTLWWRLYGSSRNLRVYTFWNGALLVGVLPCFTESIRVGPFSFCRLSLLGEDEIYGEYSPLVERASVKEVAQSAASLFIYALRSRVIDAMDFHGFAPDSQFMERFVDELRAGSHVRLVRENQPHTVVEGVENGEAYLKKMSRRRRHNLRREEKRLKAAGAETEIVTEWDGGAAFDDIVRLHTARWARDGHPGRFGSPKFEQFLRSSTECLMPQGKARIYFMRSGSERVCGLLVFDVHQQNYQYLIGRNPDHPLMQFSVGDVLTMHAMIDAFNQGALLSDLMGGDYHHKHYSEMTQRWYARATAVASGKLGGKGYMYLGALATRDALLRKKQMQGFLRKRLHRAPDAG